jgi:hypothetical protein
VLRNPLLPSKQQRVVTGGGLWKFRTISCRPPRSAVPRGEPSIEIEVKVTATTEVEVDVTVTPVDGRSPGPPGAPRYRFIFSDDLVLERIDNKKPGNGLPESPQNRLAGTHSGFATTLRVADANDKFFPEGSMLFQYEGTFMFDAVTPDLPTDLPRGQVIVRGWLSLMATSTL